MSRIYDLWGKLVGAVQRKEKDRQLAYCESFSTSTRCSSDLGSPFSLDLRLRDATEAVTYEFESRKQIEEDIMATLRGEHVKMMGICGMGCEDQDKDKRKKSSDQGVIKMLQGMKATLLLLKNLEHDNAKERPTTSSAIDADKQSDLHEEEEEEEESTAEQKKSEGDNLPGDYKEEEKSLEDSMEPVKGRPVAKTTKPRRRDSNRSSKQGGATSAALNDVVKSGLFMGKADNEDDTTANDDVEKEDPNFRQDSEVEQNTDLPAENNEEKTLEDSAAAIALKGRSNTKSRKLDSNRSAQPGGAATLNDAVKCGVFMEKAIMEKDDADDLDEGRDEEDNISGQVTRSVEEEENVSTNSVSLQKRNEGRKQTKKNVSNRSANAQRQQAKPKRPSVNMASAAPKKMVKPLVNDLTKSGDDKSEGQEAVPDDGGDGGAADIEDEQSQQLEEVQELGGIDFLEGLMDDPLGLSGLGLENGNEVKRLVVETYRLLQQFMKNNKGRRRQTDTAKSIYVASDFMEPQPDIDDDDDDGELHSLPQEKEPETGERSAEEKATENYGSLLKGKNVLKRPPNKHTKTVRHDLDRSAEDAAMKSDEPGEVTGEGSMEENESPQPEFEAEEKSPVKDEAANNEPDYTMSNVFSTPGSKTMKPGKRGPNRLAQSPLQRAGAEKKPMSSIANVVKSSGDESKMANDDDPREEDQNVLQEEKVTNDDDGGKKDQDFPQEPQEEETAIDDDAGEEDQNLPEESGQEQEMVGNVVAQEGEQKQKVGEESGEIRSVEEMTHATGNEEHKRPVARNIKAEKLNLHHSAKTQQLNQGKAKGYININAVMESDVFEQQQELEQEAKTEEISSLQDYKNVFGLDESLAMSKALLKGNDGPKRPVKVGKSDLNRSAKTQSHPAESMWQKMSYDPQVILEHKEAFIDEDAMEELQEPGQETEEDENEGMRSADFESLLKGNETRGVSKNTKAGKRDSSGLAALNAAMGSGVLEQQEEMVIGDRSVEDYQIDYKSLLKAGDELKSEMTVGKKRVSPKPQLKQPKSTMSSVATPIGVFGKQEMVAAVKESGEFLEQDMVNDVGVGVGVDVEEEDQNLVQEYKNSERQVMIRNKKRAVAPTKKSLSKPQLQLQAKPNRPSIESGAFEEQIDQEILPDDGGDGIGDADEEAEEEEEEEKENVTTEELSQSTSV